MASLGLTPGYLMALLSGSVELFGALALLFGLMVRPAAAALGFSMVVAILSVHIGHGLFLATNGCEYALAPLAVAIGCWPAALVVRRRTPPWQRVPVGDRRSMSTRLPDGGPMDPRRPAAPLEPHCERARS